MKEKEIKTNAMRMLDKSNIKYSVINYECKEFIDACQIADQIGQPYHKVFKTLVTIGKSKNYFVFVIPIDQELDLKKAATAVNEKSVEMIHVKDINQITGYIRGGCTPIGMKKQFKTVIHSLAEKQPAIIISGGRLGAQIELAPADLIKVTGAVYHDIIFIS